MKQNKNSSNATKFAMKFQSIFKQTISKETQTISKLKGLILSLLLLATKLNAQSNCCNNDTIYFDNQVDCPLCITIECFDPNTGSSILETPDTIMNNLPLSSWPSNCPPQNCRQSKGYIACGGPASPQLGKIILQNNPCERCPAFKFNLTQEYNNSIFPPLTIFSTGGPNSGLIMNSLCCPLSSYPNLEFSFDCNTKTLSFKCVQ